MKATWAKPTPAMIEYVAANLRPVDAEECRLSSGLHPRDALRVSVAVSHVNFAALADGVPVLLFGGSNGPALDERTGMVWELGTTWIDRHPLTFMRHSRTALGMLWDALDVDRAGNTVWIENEASRRWLYWLGASFELKAEPGAFGGLFLRFTLEREA